MMNYYMANWKEILEELIKSKGNEYTPTKLAHKIGAHDVTIRNILTGYTLRPNFSTKSKLESFFNVKIDDSDIDDVKVIKLRSDIMNDLKTDYGITEVITEEDRKILKKIKELGIDTEEKFRQFLRATASVNAIKRILDAEYDPELKEIIKNIK